MNKLLLIATVVALLAPASAWATVFEHETFDAGWTMSSAGWGQDRKLPALVESTSFDGDDRLHFHLSPDDFDANNTFYNYQGIGHSVTMPEWGLQSLSIDLYVDNWESSNVGLWGVGRDSAGEISAYPILVYRRSQTVDAGFYTFDYINGGWNDAVFIDPIDDLGSWYTLSFELTVGEGIEYFVNGASCGTFADDWTTDISSVILNAYNVGVETDVYFDNFTASATPEPASFAVWSLLALVGVAVTGWRRR